MKLFGRLRHGITRDRWREVIEAPADFNRAARRAVGIFGRAWAWDARALGIDPDLPPRYVRRHWTPSLLTTAGTRRQRKHKARIMRAMKARMA